MALASLAEFKCYLVCERQMPTNWGHLKCMDCLGEWNISRKHGICIYFNIIRGEVHLDGSSS